MTILLSAFVWLHELNSKQKVNVDACEAKGGTYFINEHKCLAIKEIK